MYDQPMFNWIYWDPERVIFTLPLIDRPIVWYGVFFALGFFLGFHLLLRLFKQYLAHYPQLTASDIEDWDILLYGLEKKRKEEDPITLHFFTLMPGLTKENLNQEKVIEALNQTMMNSKLFYRYFFEDLQKKRWIHSLIRFGQKKLSDDQAQLFYRRLYFGEKFAGIISFKKRSTQFCEKFAMYVMIGTIIGARLGHLVFYEPMESYLKIPLTIIKTWEGGLASHGGVIGISLALFFFLLKMRKKIPSLSFVRLGDFLVIPTAFAGALIRMGNFLNQEVLGTVTTVPWAIIFGHAADGSAPMPRHPAQLYEALFYLGVFAILLWLWNRKSLFLTPGKLSGLFFILVFSFRFVIEYLKEEQSALITQSSPLLMGQLLSIPLIILGMLLFLKRSKRQDLSG